MADGSSNFGKRNSQHSKSIDDVTSTNAIQILKLKERVVISEQLKRTLESAKEFLSRKEYGKSLSYFAYIVHHTPSLSDHVHDDFLLALKHWSSILAEYGKTEDLVKCLQEATKLFPNSAEIANNVGAVLYRLNQFDDAAVNFRRALKLNPQLSKAEENLDSIANLLVERWHFRMLNDKLRNQAYRNAISRAVKNGHDQVLDIGSGTCILSMFAIKSGAKEVHACEMSKTMYDLSLDILSANQMRDSVHVINKKSYDLTIPADLPGRVSLIVTETLDCGLLGEGIIETLTHAKHELLATNQSSSVTQVIPQGAIVYGQIIQCEKIRNYSQVNSNILGHDISNAHIKGGEISEKGYEPYTTEDMSCTDYVPLSAPFHVMSYDFQNPENYSKDLMHGLTVSVVTPGCIDAIMVWFELKLDDHETLSSAPGQSVCWEQAVYPCNLKASKQVVNAGDKASVNVTLTSSAICLEVESVSRKRDVQEIPMVDNVSITLPYQEISKLNDVKLSTSNYVALVDAFRELQMSSNQCLMEDATLDQHGDLGLIHDLTQDLPEMKSTKKLANNTTIKQHGCIVLNSSPSFNPLFAIWAGFSPVICVSDDTNFTQCLKTLADSNYGSESVNGGGAATRICFTDKPLEELGEFQACEVLLVDPVEPSGLLRQGVIEDIVLTKGCVLSKSNGVVLPRKIEVWGMLISSSSLCQKSHVTGDDVTIGLNIAEYMNTLQVKNQIDVDVQSNPFESLTEPSLLLTLDFMKPDDDDSLLSILDVTCDTCVTAMKDSLADGLMYWFVLGYAESEILSTGPGSNSRFNQVVIMFKEKLVVFSGQKLQVKTSCKNSCVTATIQMF